MKNRLELSARNRSNPVTLSFKSKSALFLTPAMAMLAWGSLANAATINWDILSGLTGDGVTWTDRLNWAGDALPLSTDNLIFGNSPAQTIVLPTNQTANQLTFNSNYTLGALGGNSVPTNTSGTVNVASGVFATINAAYNSAVGLNIVGGGSLFLNNPTAAYTGNISVDGAGTSLVFRGDQPLPQYNGVNGAQDIGRGDMPSLGVSTTVKTITLTNGGEFRYLGGGNNP